MPSTSYMLTMPWTAPDAALLPTLKWNCSVTVKPSHCNIWMHLSSTRRCLVGGPSLPWEPAGTHRLAEVGSMDYEDKGQSAQYPGLSGKQRQGDEGSVVESDIDRAAGHSLYFEQRIYYLRIHASALRDSKASPAGFFFLNPPNFKPWWNPLQDASGILQHIKLLSPSSA